MMGSTFEMPGELCHTRRIYPQITQIGVDWAGLGEGAPIHSNYFPERVNFT